MGSASAVRHILVCPFEHVETIDDLSQKKDIDLVKEMYPTYRTIPFRRHQLGLKYLCKHHPGEEYRFGFNESPDVNIYHLHLHGYVFSGPNKMKDETKSGHSLKTPEELVQILQSRRKESSPTF